MQPCLYTVNGRQRHMRSVEVAACLLFPLWPTLGVLGEDDEVGQSAATTVEITVQYDVLPESQVVWTMEASRNDVVKKEGLGATGFHYMVHLRSTDHVRITGTRSLDHALDLLDANDNVKPMPSATECIGQDDCVQ